MITNISLSSLEHFQAAPGNFSDRLDNLGTHEIKQNISLFVENSARVIARPGDAAYERAPVVGTRGSRVVSLENCNADYTQG